MDVFVVNVPFIMVENGHTQAVAGQRCTKTAARPIHFFLLYNSHHSYTIFSFFVLHLSKDTIGARFNLSYSSFDHLDDLFEPTQHS